MGKGASGGGSVALDFSDCALYPSYTRNLDIDSRYSDADSYILFRGHWRWGFLTAIWVIAIKGLVLEVVLFSIIPPRVSLSFFLGLGWVGVISGERLIRFYGTKEAGLMIVGGLLYSTGAVIDFAQWPTLVSGIIGPHEIFHLFVIGGSASFWIFIYQRAGHPVITELIVDVVKNSEVGYYGKIQGENIKIEAGSLDEFIKQLRRIVCDVFPAHLRPAHIILKHREESHIDLT